MEYYLRQLISMPTVSSDHAANNKALDYLQAFFEERGLYVMRYSFNGVGSLVATIKKDDKTPKVLLAAHLDVVPGEPAQFTLRKEEGKYFGRGVFDMKLAIAAYMQVVDTLHYNLSDYDFGIMITADEEVGGSNGVERLVDLGYHPEICILPDGAENWEIEVLAKGLWWSRLRVNGVAAHGSRPWEGDSASFKMIDLLHDIKQAFANQAPLTDTLNIGTMRSGETVNQVPAYAEADLDIRYLSEESLQKVKDEILQLCEKHAASLEVIVHGLPCINSLENPYIKTYKELVEQTVGITPQGVVAHGGTDGRFFTAIDVPCIISSPEGGNRHGADEWVSVQSAETFTQILHKYLEKVARKA